MSDASQSQSLREDIAFIRAMVEEGRTSPYRGEISLAAGLIWGTASLYIWAAAAGLWIPPGGVEAASWAWLVAIVVAAVVGVRLGTFRPRSANRVAAAAWGAVGLACWAMSMAVLIAANRTHEPVIFSLLPPMIMALYGGGWLVGAVAFRAPWQRWIGGLCLLSSLALAFAAAQPLEFLLFALSLYGLAALPGLVAVIRSRRNA
jgi:hypothetical protein